MLKTYSHLLAARRMPSEYELVSSELRYNTRLGSAVRTPVVDFQARYPLSLQCSNWDAFCDPRQTTYSTYVSEQRDKENFVEHLLAGAGDDYDRELDPRWLGVLARVLAPMRYPCHGLHMLSAYVAQAAPSGRITIAAAFQTGDELRRVQQLAYRTKQLMLAHPGFGDDAQALWEHEPAWQPLRELIEHMLVAYEWGEAFIALELVTKPLFDEWSCTQLAWLARRERDDLLARMLLSLRDDQRWHRAWSSALLRQLLQEAPQNAERVREVIARWQPQARRAIARLGELLAPVYQDATPLMAAVLIEQQRHFDACGLDVAVDAGAMPLAHGTGDAA
jgi:toluene monooxygenase system protein E